MLTGLAALVVGVAVATTPLWSAQWNALAQQQAAQQFLAAERRTALYPNPPAPTAPLVTVVAPAGTGTSPAAASAAILPASAPAVPPGQPLARLVIPAIGVDSYVLEGLTFDASVWEGLLQRGPAHLEGSALPGAPGNAVIFGHVNVWGSVFQHLNRLRQGDAILLETPGGTFTYAVTGSQRVAPSDAAAVRPHGGPATLQLVTCAGPWDSERLIVDARLRRTTSAVRPVSLAAAKALVATHEAALLRPRSPTPAPTGLAGAWSKLHQVAWRRVRRALGHADWMTPWQALLQGRWHAAWADVLHTVRVAFRNAMPTRAAPAPSLRFTIIDAWALAGGRARVIVTERSTGGRPSVGKAAATATGQTDPGDGGAGAIVRVLAYTVGPGISGPVLSGIRPVTFRPPLLFHVSPPATRGWMRGAFSCAGDSVHWWVGPVRAIHNHGFTFEARSSTVTVLRPEGMPLTGIALPGLAGGTVPVACGDLTGDGSNALVVQTVLPPETASAPAGSAVAVYRLGTARARLIGQMVGVGSTAAPRLVQTAQDMPYTILVPQGTGSPERWIFNGGTYLRVTAGAAAGAGTGNTAPPGGFRATPVPTSTPAGAPGSAAAHRTATNRIASTRAAGG